MIKSLLVLLAAVALLLTGCVETLPIEFGDMARAKMSDEEQIAYILEDVQLGLETKRIYKVLSHVSRSYRDKEGRDYEALQEQLSTLMKQYREIRITRARPRIQVQGNSARAIETFGTIAEPDDPMKDPPINLQGQVAVYFERMGGEWKIIEWGPLQ